MVELTRVTVAVGETDSTFHFSPITFHLLSIPLLATSAKDAKARRKEAPLGCVPEDGEEVAGRSGGDEQMPDEMAIRELLGQVKSDPAGVSESAGGQPE